METQHPSTSILVFAKAPVEGTVKTRLIPELGPKTATGLHTGLVKNTLNSINRTGLASVQLWCAPDSRHEFFQQCSTQWPISLHKQEGENLGERMFHAMKVALRSNEQVLIVGTDCPQIDQELLESAIEELQKGNDVVLSPADDGGYVLMGVRKLHPSLFNNIPWGEDTVFNRTAERLNYLGWKWKQLQGRWDVDRPSDVMKLVEMVNANPDSFLHQSLNQFVNNNI